MRHLDDRKSTMMAGLSYAHLPSTVTCVPPWLAIPWITATHRLGYGLVVSLHQRWPDRDSGIGVQWNSENQNEYYYGVSPKSPLAAVCVAITRTTAGALPGAERQLQLPRRLECLRYRTYTRLSDEVTDSPMVDKSWTA